MRAAKQEQDRQTWVEMLLKMIQTKAAIPSKRTLAMDFAKKGGNFEQLPAPIKDLNLPDCLEDYSKNTLLCQCIGQNRVCLKSLSVWAKACKELPLVKKVEALSGLTAATIWLATQHKEKTTEFQRQQNYQRWSLFAKACAQSEGMSDEQIELAIEHSADVLRGVIAESQQVGPARMIAISGLSDCAALARCLGLDEKIRNAYLLESKLEHKKAKEQKAGWVSGSAELQWAQALWHAAQDNAELVFTMALEQVLRLAPQQLEKEWETSLQSWAPKKMRLLEYCLSNGRYALAHRVLDAGAVFLKEGLSNPFLEFRKSITQNKDQMVGEHDKMFARLQKKAQSELESRGLSPEEAKKQIDKWHDSSLRILRGLKNKSAFERIVLTEISDGVERSNPQKKSKSAAKNRI